MTTSDPESVMAQDDWLRRLARALVRDADLADDLVQDAWLASLEQNVRRRPWLVGVLRRRRARTFRDAAREEERRLRAGELANSDSAPTDEVVADLEMRERVLHEVRALDEPFRSAVYRRYVLDESVGAIAKDTGVARSTASERVARGIEIVRTRLDRAHGGGRHAWAAPLVRAASPAAIRATSLRTIASSGAAKLIGSVAALLLLASVSLEITRSRVLPEGPQVASREARPIADGDEPTTRELATLAPEPGKRSPAGVAKSTTGPSRTRFVGRFTLSDGSPASGAQWRLKDGGSRTIAEGALDAAGKLDVSAERQVEPVSLAVRAIDHAGVAWLWFSIRDRDVIRLGDTRLPSAIRLTGRVVDERGTPVVGRSITAMAVPDLGLDRFGDDVPAVTPCGPTEVDPATGRFELERLPVGHGMRIRVRDAVLGTTSSRSLVVTDANGPAIDVVLPGVSDASPTVVVQPYLDAFAAFPEPPPVRATILAPDGSRRDGAWSSSARRFEFSNVGPGPHRVEISDPRFEPWSEEGIVANRSVKASLRGSASIELDARESSGAAAALTSVEAVLLTERPRPQRTLSNLSELIPGNYEIVARGETGVARRTVSGLEAGERRRLSVTLRPPSMVTGHVRRADGEPLLGADIELVVDGTQDTVSSVVTDESGHFELEAPGAGSFCVRAGLPRGPRSRTSPFEVIEGESVSRIDVIVSAGARVIGRIEVPSGVSLAGWQVVPLRANLEPPASIGESVRVDGETMFDIGPLVAGPARLYLLPPGSMGLLPPGEPPIGGLLLDELTLHDGNVIERSLSFPGPIPVEVTLDVSIEGVEGGGARARFFPPGSTIEAAELEGTTTRVGPGPVPQGRYEVALVGPSWCGAVTEPIQIEEGPAMTVEVSIEVVERRVRFVRDGEPLRDRRVSLRRLGGPAHVTLGGLSTDEEGWLLVGLQPGSHRFRIDLPTESRDAFASIDWPLDADGDVISVR